jgi:hypothetical protein
MISVLFVVVVEVIINSVDCLNLKYEKSILVSNNLQLLKRTDDSKIIHFEAFSKLWPTFLLKSLPLIIKPKPIAKTGIRSFSASSAAMDDIILSKFQNITQVNLPFKRVKQGTGVHNVGLFVYMWVNPKYRKQQFGDFLLDLAIKECKSRGDDFMLIVHDDNGSGRLINYYLEKGFYDVSNLLPNGMICKID